MKIYRVEHKFTRAGPYSHYSEAMSLMCKTQYATVNHWGPEEEPENFEVFKNYEWDFRYRDYLFGFESMGKFREWFFAPTLMPRFKREGFILAVYESDEKDVLLGQKQVAFRRSDAKLISQLDIVTTRDIWLSSTAKTATGT